jgi:hypothetical protein
MSERVELNKRLIVKMNRFYGSNERRLKAAGFCCVDCNLPCLPTTPCKGIHTESWKKRLKVK